MDKYRQWKYASQLWTSIRRWRSSNWTQWRVQEIRKGGGGGRKSERPFFFFILLFNFQGGPAQKIAEKMIDGQKVGHFLITIQNSFKLIINQLWTWNGNSDESGFILKHISWIHFNLFLKKVSISLWKLCLKLRKCVTIEYSFNEIFWLSLQWLGHM